MKLKFECSIQIDALHKEVALLWAEPENLSQWQEGFIGIEHISRPKGQEGSKSTMMYLMRGKEMELHETIIKNELPRQFIGDYVHEHMSNRMTARFLDLGDGKTEYWSEIHYTEFNGFIVKVFARLFPSMFKKQVMKWMKNFKHFAEEGKGLTTPQR